MDKHRLSKFGLTPKQYYDMVDKQSGLCALENCSKPAECVDHDHETGKVRQLLCRFCNVVVGWYENEQHRNAVIEYLERHSHQNSPFGHRDESEPSAPLESVRYGYDEFGPARGFKPDDLLGGQVVPEPQSDLPKDNGWALCTDLTCFCRTR